MGYLDADGATVVREALEYAAKAHEGQRRKSGEPFVIHPIEVACVLAEMRMDSDTLCAGLLHDVVEDTSYTVDDMRERFGPAVANIVAGVTDEDGAADADNERELLLAMSAEWRVALVKLAMVILRESAFKGLPKVRREPHFSCLQVCAHSRKEVAQRIANNKPLRTSQFEDMRYPLKEFASMLHLEGRRLAVLVRPVVVLSIHVLN